MKSCTEGPVVCWKIYSPVRTLRWELALPVSTQEVWAAWTDPVEITKWAAPGAAVELEPGGAWEAHFYPDRPPGQRGSDANEILSLVAGRELVIAAGAPPEYPTVRSMKTAFKVQLEAVGDGHTLVRVEQSGWRAGDEWERAFEDLAEKNREWLSWLHRRFVEGPIDWAAVGLLGEQSDG